MKGTKTTTTVEITIHEGKNRQVRKMCAAVGNKVIALERVAIGEIGLADLPKGIIENSLEMK